MTKVEFVEQYSGAPCDLAEVAAAATALECPHLRRAAQEYLEALENFENELADAGVELG